MQKKVKIGVFGAGHLGKHHIKHLSNHSLVDFVGFFDTDQDNAQLVSKNLMLKVLITKMI